MKRITFVSEIEESGMFAGIILLCMMNICDSVNTQKNAIIIDAETKARISNASVVFDDTIKVQSIWDGSFEIPDSFKVMKISSEGYLQRIMYASELTDTIEMINNGRYLDEVVVWGNYLRPQFGLSLNTGDALTMSGAGSGGGSISFDFFQTIDNVLHYKRNKRRKRIQKIISDY